MSQESFLRWRVFSVLYIGCLFGTIVSFPYVFTLQRDIIADLPIPLSVLFVSNIIQSAVLFFILVLAGLYLSHKMGLGAYILERWSEGKEIQSHIKAILPLSIVLGVLAGILIIFCDVLFSLVAPLESITIVGTDPEPWMGFLVSFYGGINEEVLMRFFLVSLIVFVLSHLKKTKDGKPTHLSIWIAIVVAALVFGLGHLPLTSSLTTITPVIVLRALILNGIGGIIFGWLYWRKGLESAMTSHFSADIVLHAIFPLIASF